MATIGRAGTFICLRLVPRESHLPYSPESGLPADTYALGRPIFRWDSGPVLPVLSTAGIQPPIPVLATSTSYAGSQEEGEPVSEPHLQEFLVEDVGGYFYRQVAEQKELRCLVAFDFMPARAGLSSKHLCERSPSLW